MDIKLWYSEELGLWRWRLMDINGKQQSGQQKDLRVAMGDVANTVEYTLENNK